ncbi:SRPBCC family protein [Demequina globuliformis]|uniref:SRPBCC family protein n=1 Tax=Demequina globuliformis TaxID=676202 RepID=UPI00078584DC|nr:SRPBCC family protein [Demequina globuliformis]
MKVRSVEASRVVAAPVETVFAVLTDLDSAVEVISAIRKVERLEGDGYEVGTRWRETRKMFGAEASEVMEVTGVNAPESTTVGSLSHGVYYTTEFRVEPEADGAVLTCAFTGAPRDQSLMQRWGWTLFGAGGMKASRKALEADLADIAKEAERRAAADPL